MIPGLQRSNERSERSQIAAQKGTSHPLPPDAGRGRPGFFLCEG